MEISWGDFYFHVEGTAAMLIAAAPVVIFIQLPPVMRLFYKIVIRLKKPKLSTITERLKKEETS